MENCWHYSINTFIFHIEIRQAQTHICLKNHFTATILIIQYPNPKNKHRKLWNAKSGANEQKRCRSTKKNLILFGENENIVYVLCELGVVFYILNAFSPWIMNFCCSNINNARERNVARCQLFKFSKMYASKQFFLCCPLLFMVEMNKFVISCTIIPFDYNG